MAGVFVAAKRDGPCGPAPPVAELDVLVVEHMERPSAN